MDETWHGDTIGLSFFGHAFGGWSGDGKGAVVGIARFGVFGCGWVEVEVVLTHVLMQCLIGC